MRGDHLGPYTIVDFLGGGGMGEVFLAKEDSLGRMVALKILRPSSSNEESDAHERFLAEGRALAKLHHPNLVTIYSIGEADGFSYLAMEYAPGQTLDWNLKRGTLSVADDLALFKQLCHGIQEAHAHSIIHRDLKPANVVVSPNGQAKIVDFGIAKDFSVNGQTTTAGVIMGTLNYLAPEIARGSIPTVQTDIYGLGAILFEMLTGQPPFVSDNNLQALERIKNEPVILPAEIAALLPDELCTIVLTMLEKDRAFRYKNLNEVLTALAAVNIDQLPRELKLAHAADLVIANEKEVKAALRERGFHTREASMIFNIACEIQQKSSAPQQVDDDRTVKIDLNTKKLILEADALTRAEARFLQIRNEITSKKHVRTIIAEPVVSRSIGIEVELPVAVKRQTALYVKSALAMSLALIAGVGLWLQRGEAHVAPVAPPAIVESKPPVARTIAEATPQPTPAQPQVETPPQPTLDPDVIADLQKKGEKMRNVKLEVPSVSPGDQWTYVDYSNNSAEITVTVESVDQDKITYREGNETRTEGFFGAPGLEKLFPLRLLNSVDVTLDGVAAKCQSFANGLEKQRFKTPAGSFDIAPIICKSEDSESQDMLYHSQEAHRFIFMTSKRPGKPDRTLMLKELKLKN